MNKINSSTFCFKVFNLFVIFKVLEISTPKYLYSCKILIPFIFSYFSLLIYVYLILILKIPLFCLFKEILLFVHQCSIISIDFFNFVRLSLVAQISSAYPLGKQCYFSSDINKSLI